MEEEEAPGADEDPSQGSSRGSPAGRGQSPEVSTSCLGLEDRQSDPCHASTTLYGTYSALLQQGGCPRVTKARVWCSVLEYPRANKLYCNVVPAEHEMSEDEVQSLFTSFWRHSTPSTDEPVDSGGAATLSRYALHRLQQDQAARVRFLPDDALLFENVGSCSGDMSPTSPPCGFHQQPCPCSMCNSELAWDEEGSLQQGDCQGEGLAGLVAAVKRLLLCCLCLDGQQAGSWSAAGCLNLGLGSQRQQQQRRQDYDDAPPQTAEVTEHGSLRGCIWARQVNVAATAAVLVPLLHEHASDCQTQRIPPAIS